MTPARRRTLAARLLLCAALAVPLACAPVKPWERTDLARRCMTTGFAVSGMEAAYWRKIHETLTAGTLTTTAAGGGCGCSQ